MKHTLGSTTSSTAMHARFRSPPETPRTNTPPMIVSAQWLRPNSVIAFSATAIFSFLA
jgi:hypothetical protein